MPSSIRYDIVAKGSNLAFKNSFRFFDDYSSYGILDRRHYNDETLFNKDVWLMIYNNNQGINGIIDGTHPIFTPLKI